MNLLWNHFLKLKSETGKVSFKNLRRVSNDMGANMTDEELHAMIHEADKDGDGEINEEEFTTVLRLQLKVSVKC